MKFGKLILAAILVSGFVGQDNLQAQSPTIYYISNSTSNSYTGGNEFEYQSDGTVIAVGNYNTSNVMAGSDTGQAVKMIWYPSLASFRAGSVDGTAFSITVNSTDYVFTGAEWSSANMGSCSTAMGVDTVALGSYSTAFGARAAAIGSNSFAAGVLTVAGGTGTVALGDNCDAYGSNSIAMGHLSVASGSGSLALGVVSTAIGSYSTAIGYYANAVGVNTVAFGNQTYAEAQYSAAFGRYNLGLGSTDTNTWVATDPLVEVGNGTGSSAKADALVVLKNGNVTAQGYIRSSPGGDLSMGNYTAAPSGEGNPAIVQP